MGLGIRQPGGLFGRFFVSDISKKTFLRICRNIYRPKKISEELIIIVWVPSGAVSTVVLLIPAEVSSLAFGLGAGSSYLWF